VVFKRRDRRTIVHYVADLFYPRGGWQRAYMYVRHRLHRLPDPPKRIARGIFAGVFVCFTPCFGLHFILAALVAKIMRANIIAALLATFFGNPVTFPVIATISLQLGHFMLGTEFRDPTNGTLTGKVLGASGEFWHNFLALFSERDADWSNLAAFYSEVFLPYFVGGLVPGAITASILYYLSLPVITAYKKSRTGKLKTKLKEFRAKKAARKADEAGNQG